MPVVVEVASSSGSTMLSDWNSTLSLSFRKDGRVSVLGHALLPDENGRLHMRRTHSVPGIKDAEQLGRAIEAGLERLALQDFVGWHEREHIVSLVAEHAPKLAAGLRSAWARHLDDTPVDPGSL